MQSHIPVQKSQYYENRRHEKLYSKTTFSNGASYPHGLVGHYEIKSQILR